MKSKKDIKREYRERGNTAGVFMIKNTANGRMLIGSCLNIDGILNSQKFQLTIGQNRNRELQKEWNEYGPDNFVFEILEAVQDKDNPDFNLDDELTLLEQIWIEKLQPFSGRGYNADPNIRLARYRKS